jgi:hypothetical protein
MSKRATLRVCGAKHLRIVQLIGERAAAAASGDALLPLRECAHAGDWRGRGDASQASKIRSVGSAWGRRF